MGLVLALAHATAEAQAPAPDPAPSARWAGIASVDAPRSMGTMAAAPEKARAGAARAGLDHRLILQIGMLLIFVYLTFLAVWFAATQHLRAVGFVEGLRRELRRVRGRSAPRVEPPKAAAPSHMVVRVPGPTPAGATARWRCEIAWRPEPVRLQAVMARDQGAVRRVIAESQSLPWPPKDPSKPPTRELQAALETLVASVEAAGWQPVRFPGGTWLERRFVWLHDTEPPSRVQLLDEVPEAHTSARAPRGENRRAVLRVVAERPGVSAHELATASGVKPGSLYPLLARLIRDGELERRELPGGRSGYFLAGRSGGAEQPAEAPELEGAV